MVCTAEFGLFRVCLGSMVCAAFACFYVACFMLVVGLRWLVCWAVGLFGW